MVAMVVVVLDERSFLDLEIASQVQYSLSLSRENEDMRANLSLRGICTKQTLS